MGKCSDFCDLVRWTVCAIGAVLLFLPAIAAIAALFGLFIVLMRLPIDLFKSNFVEKTSGYFREIQFQKLLNYYHNYRNHLKNNQQFLLVLLQFFSTCSILSAGIDPPVCVEIVFRNEFSEGLVFVYATICFLLYSATFQPSCDVD